MSPIGYVAILQIGGGLLGSILSMPSSSAIRLPYAPIDDPSKGWRILNRSMLFLMCNMLSWFSTLALLEGLLDQPVKRALALGPDVIDALLLLIAPLPIAWLFYLSFAWFQRWWHRSFN